MDIPLVKMDRIFDIVLFALTKKSHPWSIVIVNIPFSSGSLKILFSLVSPYTHSIQKEIL